MPTRDFLALQQRIAALPLVAVRFVETCAYQPDPTRRYMRAEAGAVRRLPEPLARDLARRGLVQILMGH